MSTRKQNLLVRYGLSEEAYQDLLTLQEDSCAICLRRSNEFKRRLAVDHNHKTGQVRGLLCYRCNVTIGTLKDNPILIRRMASYLENEFKGLPLTTATQLSIKGEALNRVQAHKYLNE